MPGYLKMVGPYPKDIREHLNERKEKCFVQVLGYVLFLQQVPIILKPDGSLEDGIDLQMADLG